MTKTRLRGRAALAGAIALVCAGAAACDSVLDIEDPKARPNDGEAGETGTAGKANNAAGTASAIPEGGAAGEGGSSPSGGGGTGPIVTAGNGGEGGDATPRDCETDSLRCTDKAPEICDDTGHWVPNTEEAEGDCAVACNAGKCVECAKDEKRCAVCEEDDQNCNTNQPQTCVDGAWTNEGTSCKHYCNAGECVTPPSCEEQYEERTTCGNSSCCTSLLVPGGTFKRDFDGTEDYSDDSFPATLTSFYLDKYEVTVGRMRQFLSAFDQLNLKDGSGKSAHIAADSGWDTRYELPADGTALTKTLNDCTGSTWSDNLNQNNQLPVNCLPFNIAYAFCIWDGGRLPTEAEWNYAAAGGSEQRIYPWILPSSGAPITESFAHFGSVAPNPVGSKPLGNGRWQHSDLAGNVSEWTLDFFGDYPPTCNDCLNSSATVERTERGGSYAMIGELLIVSLRGYDEPATARSQLGFRCARDLN
jgi:formylglycine-generating enzyme